MLPKTLLTFGRRLVHQKYIFKGPILRALREPECNSIEVPQVEEDTATVQLPDYIDPKCLQPVTAGKGVRLKKTVNGEQHQDEKQKSYDYKYHSYSLYDLHEATTRLAAEQSKKKAKN
ncbi:GL18534 [Drosophila persimilis]|uniref:GL18534 n=1 Tax=Drosophila persimilis TaxID=7234 RepID=B4G708_DROPE|nr:uncharacterized protein LOC6588683 [Drosophila persimilis]EDW29207.1 GL18534 [Drosophila persimilis]